MGRGGHAGIPQLALLGTCQASLRHHLTWYASDPTGHQTGHADTRDTNSRHTNAGHTHTGHTHAGHAPCSCREVQGCG